MPWSSLRPCHDSLPSVCARVHIGYRESNEFQRQPFVVLPQKSFWRPYQSNLLARSMVTRFGMSDSMGVMVYEDNQQEGYFGMASKTISEATQQKVDAEIRSILDTQYALSRRLLEENRDKVEVMTKALLDWETIDADQVNDIMNGISPRPPKVGQSTGRSSSDNSSGGVSPNATAPA